MIKINRSVSIDFSHKNGKIKPINGLNNGPRFGYDLEHDLSGNYREMSPPVIRLSGIEEPYAASRYLDIHCLFPDFNLDERFEASFNFLPTDRLLASVREVGAEIFLRLGESIGHGELRKLNTLPDDFDKLARICSKIIAHYNKGWGNGFKYNIKYVEIWCDTDTPEGFIGERERYFSLYAAVANRLKADYPKLRVGAYSSGGFVSLNHYDAAEAQKAYIPFLEDFIEYISTKERAPLDFLSWKCYAESPDELNLHANYARAYLSQSIFKKAESIVTEFNLKDTRESFTERSYPSRLASSFIVAQKSNIDMMFLSHLHPDSPWNPLYSLEDRTNVHLYSAYHVMTAFGALSRLGSAVDSTGDFRNEMYSLAATDDKIGAVVFTTVDYSGVIEIKIEGKTFNTYSIKGVIGGGDRASGFFTEERGIALKNDSITLRVGKNEVYFLTFYNK